jgi:hypothetical protein
LQFAGTMPFDQFGWSSTMVPCYHCK